jgi:sugar phosphate isomerase/epimerase
MSAISRREFFKKAGTDAAVGGVLAAAAGARLKANPLGLPIGSQTYPHRQMIKDGNFAGLLKTLKDIGVERIELCSALGYNDFASLSDGKQVKQMLNDHGLKCESAHFGMKELRETQDKSIAWAKDIGITQMVTATLGGGSNPTMDDVKRAADEYNKIAAVAAKAGIQQGLHNEGFELSMVDGERTYDVLMGLLDPKLVKFQFQMSTIGQGFVAHEYFTKYPGRFISMHVQDVDLNATPTPPPEPPAGQAARGSSGRGRGRGVQTSVGKGSIDWVKTFQAAKVGGVKNYFVEQNMELTKASVAALKAMQV